MVLGLLVRVTPSNFFRRILRSEALVLVQIIFFSKLPFYGNYSTLDSHTNTVISHSFAYSSRWHRKPWQGLFLTNSLFYSYRCKRGWSWPCFDKTLPALLCKSCCCYANYYFFSKISISKERGLYPKKVNLSLTFTQRLGYYAHNCKMVYICIAAGNATENAL